MTKSDIHVEYADIAQFPERVKVGPTHRHRYRVIVKECNGVSIAADKGMIAIAIRDGKAIEHHHFLSGRVTFYHDGIDEVYFYTLEPLRTFAVCLRSFKVEGDWSRAVQIASGIQIPFNVHPEISTATDARSVINSRLTPGDSLEFGRFERLFEAMNQALTQQIPLGDIVQRHGVDMSVLETQIFGTMFSLTLRPEWRRALGFGYLDEAAGLTRGGQYDYRIDGSFLRRTLEETRHDFVTVPEGTRLPRYFQTGPIRWFCATSVAVESIAHDGIGFDNLIKGIRPRQLHLECAQTERLTLDLFGHAEVQLKQRNRLVREFSVDGDGRVRLDSGTFDSVILNGEFFISSVIEHTPDDEDSVETLSSYVRAVQFIDSPGPIPVHTVRLTNLQHSDVAAREQQSPGFRIAFVPNDVAWPPDLPYAPPFSNAYWRIERARDGGDFAPYDGDEGIVVGSRHTTERPMLEGFGIDLEDRFRKTGIATSHTQWITIEDPIKGNKPGHIPFGDAFRYRIATVDIIGRTSAFVATPALRLEKHLSPPRPGGPITKNSDARAGILVSVISANDDLPPDIRQSLGDRSKGILVKWGWADFALAGQAPTERDRDPYVTEFRVYFRADDYSQVSGETQAIYTVGDHHEIEVTLSSAVDADALVGQTVDLGYPFRIIGHDAGTRITMRVHVSSKGIAPRARAFTLGRSDRESGGPPVSWDQRVTVVPFVSRIQNYHAVLPIELITISPEGPLVRGYVGVSAADNQPYVADTIVSGAHAGRAGNESFVASAPILVEYIGRPSAEPVELAVLPRVRLRRSRGDEVLYRLRFDDASPAWVFDLIRVQRIKTMEVARRLTISGTSVSVMNDLDQTSPLLLPSPADMSALSAQIRTGKVEDRFLVFIASITNFERSWTTVFAGSRAGEIVDALPNTNASWIYRVQKTDAKGRTSANYWTLPRVVEVPPQVRPPTPELHRLTRTESDEFTLEVIVNVYDVLPSILLFATSVVGQTPRELDARLVVIPNRADLPPTRTHRVRTHLGSFVEPVQLQPTDGTLSDAKLSWQVPITNPAGAELQVWACSFHDGMVSTLVGPRRMPTREVR
ncbi:MAG: hypothetical protein E8D43_00460 [Nitrospira sp.]|nr:MAG: hypothetical protein E8D43_00460 [Nitrospira sp.]